MSMQRTLYPKNDGIIDGTRAASERVSGPASFSSLSIIATMATPTEHSDV